MIPTFDTEHYNEDLTPKKDYGVSEEWRQYLIRRNFDDGIED